MFVFKLFKHRKERTYCSGSMFLSQAELSAFSADIRFSGSSSSILSNKSRADDGMKIKSSLSRRRYIFLGLNMLNCGKLMTLGQTAGVGVPHSLDIISS